MQLILNISSTARLNASKVRKVDTPKGRAPFFMSVSIGVTEGETTKWIGVNAADVPALQTRVNSLVADAKAGAIPVSVRGYVATDKASGEEKVNISFNYAGGASLEGGITLAEPIEPTGESVNVG